VDSIVAALHSFDSAFTDIEFDLADARIDPLAPGLAGVSATYRQAFHSQDGPAYTLKGAVTFTMIHRNGGWQVLYGHTSTERDGG
jgi:hypothetical protein